MDKYQAILLLGPTGSGKTPLGELFERQGLWGHKCAHFDFGENLRKIALTSHRPSFLTEQDIAVIRNCLKTGALLENETLHIASNILRSFIQEREINTEALLILNGLPRHAGQARNIDTIIGARLVVHLECPAEIVKQRIASNSGGDRSARIDDSLEEIEKKLEIFYERTMPLLDHYHARGVKVKQVAMAANTTPEEIYRALEEDYIF